MAETQEGPATEAGGGGVVITPAYRTYALVLLTIVYTANYVDRQILSILLEPIKVDLNLSDTQLGLLLVFFMQRSACRLQCWRTGATVAMLSQPR